MGKTLHEMQLEKEILQLERRIMEYETAFIHIKHLSERSLSFKMKQVGKMAEELLSKPHLTSIYRLKNRSN